MIYFSKKSKKTRLQSFDEINMIIDSSKIRIEEIVKIPIFLF